jgi:hypothetical protein
MPNVTIKLYRENGGAAQIDRVLTRTVHLETLSAKQLTSKRAGQILANEFPEFESARRGMIKTDEGWVAMRTIQPLPDCSYQYIWEHAVVTQESDSSEDSAQLNQ